MNTDNVYMQPRPVLTAQSAGSQTPGQLIAQQYVITINGNVNSSSSPYINHTAIHITAAIQLACTGLSVLLGIVAILVGCLDADFAMPIWMGLCFFMVAGILGKVAVTKKNRCWIISYMVLCIISSVAAGILVLNMLAAAFHEDYGFDISYTRNSIFRVSSAGAASIDGAVCLIALVEMITAIVAAAFCCRGTCCGPTNPVQVQYSPAMPAGSVLLPPQGPVQSMMLTQGQSITAVNPSSQPSYPTTHEINHNTPEYDISTPPIPEKQHTLTKTQNASVHPPAGYSVPHTSSRIDNGVDGQDQIATGQDISFGDELISLDDSNDDHEGCDISIDDGSGDKQPLVK